MICKYSGCHDGKDNNPKEYDVCPICLERKPWKALSDDFIHAACYQNEVAIARGQILPYPDYIDQMIKDGVITEDMLDDILVD